MILVLNGYPGTGKLTIGQTLAPLMGAKLVDIHTLYNLGFALTEFKTQAFFDATDRVEAIAHDLIHDLPKDVPVLWTTVLAGDSDRAIAAWDRLKALGAARPPLLMVHIHCDLEENIRRIQGESRRGARKTARSRIRASQPWPGQAAYSGRRGPCARTRYHPSERAGQCASNRGLGRPSPYLTAHGLPVLPNLCWIDVGIAAMIQHLACDRGTNGHANSLVPDCNDLIFSKRARLFVLSGP